MNKIHTHVNLRDLTLELWTNRGLIATATESNPAPDAWLHPNEEYHVVVYNNKYSFYAEGHPEHSKLRVLAIVAVDGNNSLEPTARASWDSRPWVVNPGSHLTVKGWQISTGQNGVVRPFVITELQNSVVANVAEGDIFQTGKITVAFKAEMRAQQPGASKGDEVLMRGGGGTLSSSPPSHATGAGQAQSNKTNAVAGLAMPTNIGWLMFNYHVIGARPTNVQASTPPGFVDPLGNVPIARKSGW